MKIFYLIFLLSNLLLAGCATTGDSASRITFHVESNPTGGVVEVNGISYGTTPIDIKLPYTKKWVGLGYSSDGWAIEHKIYKITCYPPKSDDNKRTLYVQTKVISIDEQPDGGNLYFDLRLEPSAIHININRP